MEAKRKIEILKRIRRKKFHSPFLCTRINKLKAKKLITASEKVYLSLWLKKNKPAAGSKWRKNKYWLWQVSWWDVSQAFIDGNYTKLMKEKDDFILHLIEIAKQEEEHEDSI